MFYLARKQKQSFYEYGILRAVLGAEKNHSKLVLPVPGCLHRRGSFDFPTQFDINVSTISIHHRPVDDESITKTASRASNKNKETLSIVCALVKKGMSPDPGYHIKRKTVTIEKRGRKRKSSGGCIYLRVWFVKLCRAGGVGRCQACHRRNFNGRYSVVIRSIRVLSWLRSRMQLQVAAGRGASILPHAHRSSFSCRRALPCT